MRSEVEVTVVVDFVNVIEYVRSSAWSFVEEGDRAAERRVHENAYAVLEGKAATVAASITCKATYLGLSADERKNADVFAGYLLAKRDYLDYPTALGRGWPVATGIIETGLVPAVQVEAVMEDQALELTPLGADAHFEHSMGERACLLAPQELHHRF